MSIRVLRRPQAVRDIEECFVYIGSDNLNAAFAFLDAVETAFSLLSENPAIGVIREFPHSRLEGLRMWTIGGFDAYEIFYLAGKDTIDVLTGAPFSERCSKLVQY